MEQRQQNLRLVAQVAQLEAGMAQESSPNQFLVKLEEDDVETYLCTFERKTQSEGWDGPSPRVPKGWPTIFLGRPRGPTST